VDAIELTIEEEQRRTALVHKFTQGTISLGEGQEIGTEEETPPTIKTTKELFCASSSDTLVSLFCSYRRNFFF
jgi:hypothetical protein